MRRKYFNFSNFMDVTLYVFAIVYAVNINISIVVSTFKSHGTTFY